MKPGILIVLYFLPTIIAKLRGQYLVSGAFIRNLLWGWTGVGWIILLAASLVDDKPRPTPIG